MSGPNREPSTVKFRERAEVISGKGAVAEKKYPVYGKDGGRGRNLGMTADRASAEAINMVQAAEQEEETVGITNHATEHTDGGDKSKCRLPDSVIENVILQRKGSQYLDREEDSIHFLYNSTVIITDYDPEQHRWAVITIYRDPAARTKRRSRRYEEIDVDTVVAEARTD